MLCVQYDYTWLHVCIIGACVCVCKRAPQLLFILACVEHVSVKLINHCQRRWWWRSRGASTLPCQLKSTRPPFSHCCRSIFIWLLAHNVWFFISVSYHDYSQFSPKVNWSSGLHLRCLFSDLTLFRTKNFHSVESGIKFKSPALTEAASDLKLNPDIIWRVVVWLRTWTQNRDCNHSCGRVHRAAHNRSPLTFFCASFVL